MPRDGSLTLSDLRDPTLTTVCERCTRRGRYVVARLLEEHGDAKLTELLVTWRTARRRGPPAYTIDARLCMDGHKGRSHIWPDGYCLNLCRSPRRAATLPEGREADRRPDGKGGYRITLPHDALNKLNHIRGPGQSYSDVVLALAEEGCASKPFAVALLAIFGR